MTLSWRYATRSDVGLLRDGNEDSAYAGSRLLAVADGMGGHAAGEVASAAAIAALEMLDHRGSGPHQPPEALRAAVTAANTTLRDMVTSDRELHGMGTTVTALFGDGDRSWLAHIGDSRAYLLRTGELTRLTHDHTLVQQLVDDGRLGADDVSSHPQRSVLLRALDGREPLEMDLTEVTFQPGDRLLLCTDGLSSVVSDATLRDVLTSAGTPEDAVRQLVDLALRGGGPDNITAIVADAYDDPAAPGRPAASTQTAGAANDSAASDSAANDDAAAPADPQTDTPAARAAALQPEPTPRRKARLARRRRRMVAAVAVLALLSAGTAAGWTWIRSQYYVGSDAGEVVVFRGVEGSVAGIDLSSVAERAGVPIAALPPYEQKRVQDGIHATSRRDADAIVGRLREQAGIVQ